MKRKCYGTIIRYCYELLSEICVEVRYGGILQPPWCDTDAEVQRLDLGGQKSNFLIDNTKNRIQYLLFVQ